MTPRLNVSLREEDKKALLELREILEENADKRLSIAEVVREAVRIALIYA